MIKRNSKGQFEKGSSGNPLGRKKGIRAKAIEACEKYGIDPLNYMAEVLADTSASTKDRMAAARELADRMYGKAVQLNENYEYDMTDREVKIMFVEAEDASRDTK